MSDVSILAHKSIAFTCPKHMIILHATKNEILSKYPMKKALRDMEKEMMSVEVDEGVPLLGSLIARCQPELFIYFYLIRQSYICG